MIIAEMVVAEAAVMYDVLGTPYTTLYCRAKICSSHTAVSYNVGVLFIDFKCTQVKKP